MERKLVVKVVRSDWTSLYAPGCLRLKYRLGQRVQASRDLPIFAYNATGLTGDYCELYSPRKLLLCEAHGDIVIRPRILTTILFHERMTIEEFLRQFKQCNEENGQEQSIGCVALTPLLDITHNPTQTWV